MVFLYCIAAFLVSFALFPVVLKAARRYNLVDSPGERKLQTEPVPSMGGIVVAAGVFLPLLAAPSGMSAYEWFVMAAMLALGMADDVRNLSAMFRFVVELVLVLLFLFIDYGTLLAGYGPVSAALLCLLFAIAGVGVINAINMIDGIDGLSSGFGILSCGIFAIAFLRIGDMAHALLSGVCAAALAPFYLHNVFGGKSKMYIGDGGSLFIGTVLVINAFALLLDRSPLVVARLTLFFSEGFVAAAAFCLAVLCIPVFDTLRVMSDRICHGIHPFHADKKHLHHRLLELGFSHFGASTAIILANLLIAGVWYAGYVLCCPAYGQLLLVVATGLLSTCGFYYGSLWCESRQNGLYRLLRRLGDASHLERTSLWLRVQSLLDAY